VTLRGAGGAQTFLVATSTAPSCLFSVEICVTGSNNWVGNPQNSTTWTAGYSQGATHITLGSIAALSVGQYIILDQENDLAETGQVIVADTTNNIGSCGVTTYFANASPSSGLAQASATAAGRNATTPGTVSGTSHSCSNTTAPTWSIGTTYCTSPSFSNCVVNSVGITYVSLVASNIGNTPAVSPTKWGLLYPDRNQTQVVQVTACGTITTPGTACTGAGGSTAITIAPGLYMPNWSSAKNPGAFWATSTITGFGLEDLAIDFTAASAIGGVGFVNAIGNWEIGVSSAHGNRNHVWIQYAARNVIESGYFYQTQNAASESYGVEAYVADSDNLITNNIFQQITAPYLEGSTCGNVFSYNFGVYDFYAPSSTWLIPTSFQHAAANCFNLHEGNIGAGDETDTIHGTHNFGTDFRNYFNGNDSTCFGSACLLQTLPINNASHSRYYNFVDNVLGNSTYHTTYETSYAGTCPGGAGNFNVSIFSFGWAATQGQCDTTNPIASDTLSGSTAMRWGNWDTVTNATRFCTANATPIAACTADERGDGAASYPALSSPSSTFPASFYLPALPLQPWWNFEPFPPIGSDITGGNIGACSAGTYAGMRCTRTAQCGAGATCAQILGGHANAIPAFDCYLNMLGGPPIGTGAQLPFNRHNCYDNSGPGGPLTYPARTDSCVHGYSTNPPNVFPFYCATSNGCTPAGGYSYGPTELCVPGATTGQSGSAMIYQGQPTDPVPFLSLAAGAVINTSFVDPDFHSYSFFVTDQTSNLSTTIFNFGSDGAHDAFSLGSPNDVLLNFISDGGVSFIDHVIESRVLAQSCSPANPCAIPSAITQASCTLAATYGGGNCTNQQFAGNLVFSRSPLDLPNTFYNFNTNNTLQIWKTVVTSNLSGGYPTAVTATYSLTAVNGAGVYTGSTAACVSNACVGNNITVTGFANANNNISAVVTASTVTTLTVSATTTAETHAGSATTGDTLTRALYVDFTGNDGGSIPCSVLPSDYNATWKGTFQTSNTGGVSIAMGGGGSYQTIAQQPGVTVNGGGHFVIAGNDVFVMPLYNLLGSGNSVTYMFQASAGTTAGTASLAGSSGTPGVFGALNPNEPNYLTGCSTVGSTCTDGTVQWTNIGIVNSQGPGFDVVHFDPVRGCSRINTRLAKMYRGNNEGVSWPGTGTPDTGCAYGAANCSAGVLYTDDAATCYQQSGTNCGTGGLVQIGDEWTLHDSAQSLPVNYARMSPTGGAGINGNWGTYVISNAVTASIDSTGDATIPVSISDGTNLHAFYSGYNKVGDTGFIINVTGGAGASNFNCPTKATISAVTYGQTGATSYATTGIPGTLTLTCSTPFTPTTAVTLTGGSIYMTNLQYQTISPTPNGSCTTSVNYNEFGVSSGSWPTSIAWVSGGVYAAKNRWVVDTSATGFHQFYYSLGAVTSTVPPSQDPTNWAMGNYYCDGYFPDWNSIGFAHPIVRPQLLLGPDFGAAGGHPISANNQYGGGTYFSHYWWNPNCPNITGPCTYVGQPNPGFALLPIPIVQDDHPSYRNVGPQDTQPAFAPAAAVPTNGNASEPLCYGTVQTGCSNYTEVGYQELVSYSTDGNQITARYGHNFVTGVNIGFSTQNGIGVVSQDGLMLGWSSDFQNSRGDTITGAPTCATNNTLAGGGPITAQYQWNAKSLVTVGDTLFRVGDNYIWKATSCTGSCTSGAALPSSNFCTSGCTVGTGFPSYTGASTFTETSSPGPGTVTWTLIGQNSCRGDIAIMAVQSAQPFSNNTNFGPAPIFASVRPRYTAQPGARK
jgi:hypothetical protein